MWANIGPTDENSDVTMPTLAASRSRIYFPFFSFRFWCFFVLFCVTIVPNASAKLLFLRFTLQKPKLNIQWIRTFDSVDRFFLYFFYFLRLRCDSRFRESIVKWNCIWLLAFAIQSSCVISVTSASAFRFISFVHLCFVFFTRIIILCMNVLCMQFIVNYILLRIHTIFFCFACLAIDSTLSSCHTVSDTARQQPDILLASTVLYVY